MKVIMIFLVGVGLMGFLTACASGVKSVESQEITIKYEWSTKGSDLAEEENQETGYEKTNDQESTGNKIEGSSEDYPIVTESDLSLMGEKRMNNYSNKEGETLNQKNVVIKMIFKEEEILVNLYDNPTSRDFLSLLPLTLTFEDYAGTEKISYLSRKLSTEDAPTGFDPSVGDVTLYAPWGNLAIFYQDFGYAAGLVPLGRIDAGIEKLAEIQGDFTVLIELAE